VLVVLSAPLDPGVLVLDPCLLAPSD